MIFYEITSRVAALSKNSWIYRAYFRFVRNPYFAWAARIEPALWRSRGVPFLNRPQVMEGIGSAIKSRAPFAISKIGGNEIASLHWLQGRGKMERKLNELHYCAGVFPNDREFYRAYLTHFQESLSALDVLELWFGKSEFAIYRGAQMTAKAAAASYLGSFATSLSLGEKSSWLPALAGKRVVIISSFAEQMVARANESDWNLYWSGRLPWFNPAEVKGIPFPYGFEKMTQDRYGDSLNLLRVFKEEHAATIQHADVVIMGCGAYAIPLLAWVKSLGKCGIGLGGEIQVLFGIKGGRWDEIPGLYNEHWVRPLPHLVPKGATRIEDACYW